MIKAAVATLGRQFQTMGRLTRQNGAAIIVAAVLPFIVSHGVVLQARLIGMPYRLGLDLLHGLFVLSYLTVIVRLDFCGLARFGFCLPRPRWPGFKVLALATVAVAVVGLPVALVLHPITQALERMADQHQGSWIYVPTVMVPEFTMTTLVGLALAAALGNMNHEH